MIAALLRWGMLLTWAAIALSSEARQLWVIEQGRLVRVDTANAKVRALGGPDRVRGVAPSSDGGAWVLREDGLARFDAGMTERLLVPMSAEDLAAVGPMAAEPQSGALWLAKGLRLFRFQPDGDRREIGATFDPIRAIAIAGPDAVFVATDSMLMRYDGGGALTARLDLSRVEGREVRAMALDPLAGFLWLARDGVAHQLDVLAGISVRRSLALDARALVVDARSGELTAVDDARVLRHARDATLLLSSSIGEEVREAVGLELSRESDWLWIGNHLGLGLVDLVDGSLVRVPGLGRVTSLVAAPPRFAGALESHAQASAPGSGTDVAFRYFVTCDELACLPTVAFLRALRMDVSLDGKPLGGVLGREATGDTFSATLPLAPEVAGPTLRAEVIDAFGNRSGPATIEWPIDAQSAVPSSAKATSPPTIAITAPLNNATYTAPLSTTLKVTATPGTGATIVKVEYFAGGVPIGTASTSPYDLAWANVQPGTYALTAKVTDSAAATAISAAVNVTVNAGAAAKPTNAWLFNDAWAIATPIADAAGIRDGAAAGSVSAITSNASAPKPATCKAANFVAPGATIDVTALGVSTAAGARTTLAFWMLWNGTDDAMPASWATQGLALRGGWFGFTTQSGDVYGVASSAIANKWTHVVAEFANGGVATNKLYLNGVPQTLAQRVGTPSLANATVSTTMRIAGLYNATTSRFIGQLDEFKLWTRALTPTEVSAEFALANACDLAPSVTIGAPASNASFVAPASIAITATAASGTPNATLTKVDFYNGATLLATKVASPFTYTWASVPIGTYQLTAKATDSKGSRTTSAIATIAVKANVAPTVTVTSPATNTVFAAPATINLAATATDSDGTVSKVEFYQGSTRLATITTPPYTYAWTNVAGGTYTITAKATDNLGLIATSTAVTAIVNKPPTVSITAPVNNANIFGPVTLPVYANASDADGSIAKVEFYRDGVLIGTDTAAPYSASWSAALGTYVLTAKATDNRGAVTTSAPVTVVVKVPQPPTVQITSPLNDGRVATQAPFPVTVSATDPDGTVSKVELYWAIESGYVLIGTDAAAPYAFQATLPTDYWPIPPLIARAYDNNGLYADSVPVNVVLNIPPAIEWIEPQAWEVVAPTTLPSVTFKVSAWDTDGGSVRSVRIYKRSDQADGGTDLGGDAAPVLLASFTSPPYETTWQNVPRTVASGPGIAVHTIIVEATDDSGDMTSTEGSYHVWATSQASTETFTIVEPDRRVPLTFTAPASIVLVGKAPVRSVEWLANGVSIGTTSAPNGSNGEFAFPWRNVPTGTYVITTRFVDVVGRIGTNTDGITIKVKGPDVPAAAFGAPAQDGIVVSAAEMPFAVSGTASNMPPGAKVRVTDNYRWIADLDAPWNATIPSLDRSLNIVMAQPYVQGSPVGEPARTYVIGSLISRLPVGVVTSPSPTGNYTTATTITYAVDAKARDGTVIAVDYFEGTNILATVTSPPWTFTAKRAIGTYTVQGRVRTNVGTDAFTTPVTYRVTTTDTDVGVQVSAPVSGQRVVVPTSLPLAVLLTDPNRKVRSVTYLVSRAGTELGRITTNASPYSSSWPLSTIGSISVVARANTQNGYVDSPAVTFAAAANQAPTVSITGPTAGQAFYVGQPIPITVNATDVDGGVAKVEYFTSTGSLLGTSTTAPFTLVWSPTAAGTYAIYAKATDDRGATAQSATVTGIRIDPNAIPQVRIVSPQSGNAFGAGGTITLSATASDADGSISRIDFYAGATLIGSASAAPFAFAWPGVPAGTYALTARAVDNRGAVGVSVPVNITVQALEITITSPADGASIDADFVTVYGTFKAPPNSGVTVNGRVAATDGTNFHVNNFPLEFGSNEIAITVTTGEGQTMARTVNITRAAISPYQLLLSADAMHAPAALTLSVSKRVDRKVVSLGVAGLGTGAADMTVFDGSTLAKLSLAAPGSYQPVFTIQDDTGATYTQRLSILVLDPAQSAQRVKDVWLGFAGALGAGDKAGALNRTSYSARSIYAPTFDALAPYFTQIVPQWSAPVVGPVGTEVSELVVSRMVEGKNSAFFIYVMRDRDGVWRVVSM
ncbi:MAG: Ig-like domain-containing protein [Burkholderiales bacterium]